MNSMTTETTFVSTGSRLHFGLTRIKPGSRNCINGVGVMLDEPCTRLEFRPAEKFSTSGSERLEIFANAWSTHTGKPLPNCKMVLVGQPPEHAGFGSGTQLAHAVAHGLNQVSGKATRLDESEAQNVATICFRGNRSMVGSFGFVNGGLIVDGTDGDGKTTLIKQTGLPEKWRVIVAVARQAAKKFGLQEESAFANIDSGKQGRAAELERMITASILPSAQNGDFEGFSESVHAYGKLSGEYYVDVQGGVYNGPVITGVVNALLGLGARGVGQSSWGPAVFAWCSDEDEANEIVARLPEAFGHPLEIFKAAVQNRPAQIA